MNLLPSIPAAIAVVAVLASSAPARACGGLFCSQAAPVLQSAERIAFVDHGDGTMSAIVEILYEGPSTAFSWVLPVSGVPTLAVASSSALDALDARTRPTPRLSFEGSGCTGSGGGCTFACGAMSASGDVRGVDTDAGVVVLDHGNVGPYDYAIIAIDPGVSNQAETARTWLTTEGYDVTDFGANTLGDYLAAGQNLLAFRLSKSATTGSIRPLVMTYASTVGVIPIKPTAVAAQAGMGVMVFMLGASRAVPVTYDEIALADSAFGFTTGIVDYASALDAAVDEAGGHAFVTESAGPIAAPFDLGAVEARAALSALQTAAPTTAAAPLVDDAVRRLRSLEGLDDAVRASVPLPATRTAADVVACASCVLGSGAVAGFDADAFLEAIETYVVEPLETAEALLNEAPYVTRLFTSLDPDEMDLDPVFAFASGLPDVDPVRDVTLRLGCSDGGTIVKRVTLEDGTSYDPRRLDADTPRVLTQYDYALDGSGSLVRDNTAVIAAALTRAQPRTGGYEGCSALGEGPRARAWPTAMALASGWLVLRRSQRRRAARAQKRAGATSAPSKSETPTFR